MINLNYAKQALVTLQLPNISVCTLLATQKFLESSTSIYTQVYKTTQSRNGFVWKTFAWLVILWSTSNIFVHLQNPKMGKGIDIALQEEKNRVTLW